MVFRYTLSFLLVLLVLLHVAHAADAIKISVLEGDGAINNVRLQRAKEPVVRVETQTGAPVAGSVVYFQAPVSGPGGAFVDGNATATVMTDSEGLARAPQFRPNRTAGQFQIRVTASYQGETANAKVTQTNAEPSEALRSSSKKITILAVIAGAAAGGAALAIIGGGKSTPASTPTTNGSGTVIAIGTPSLGAP